MRRAWAMGAALALVMGCTGASGQTQLHWETEKLTDNIDSQNSTFWARIMAPDRGFAVACNRNGNKRGFVVRVYTSDYLGSQQGQEVTYKFDDDRPIDKFWNYGESVAGPTTSREAENIIRKLIVSEKAVFRLRDFDDKPHDVIVGITPDAILAINQVLAYCSDRP